jgi:hypothetical protein
MIFFLLLKALNETSVTTCDGFSLRYTSDHFLPNEGKKREVPTTAVVNNPAITAFFFEYIIMAPPLIKNITT